MPPARGQSRSCPETCLDWRDTPENPDHAGRLLSQDCAADAGQLGSALVRLIHYMLPDCEAGVILVPFYLHAAGVTRIAKLGWLTPTLAADRQAVCAAFDAFVNRAGLLGVRP